MPDQQYIQAGDIAEHSQTQTSPPYNPNQQRHNRRTIRSAPLNNVVAMDMS